MARHLESSRSPAFNWGFLLLLVLCVEFWLAVTSIVVQHL
jgi:hypothetical protein